MAYTTQKAIQTVIPKPVLKDALDDNNDGLPDDGLLDQIIVTASNAVDALLAAHYDVPFPDPAPAMVQEAAFVFSCEIIYARRERDNPNPYTARANALRETLQKISQGILQLDATVTSAIPAAGGSFPRVPARIHIGGLSQPKQ